MLKKKLQNDPQSLGNDLNISTPDTIAREKNTAKSTLYLQKNDLKDIMVFFTNRCRAGIVHIFKNSLHIYL